MPKQENTAINDLIGFVSQRPIDADEPALFDVAPPVARLRPPPVGGRMAPSGPPVARLPRRRAPAATPSQVPRQPIYVDDDDDSETTVGVAPQWPSVPSLGHEAESYTVTQPDTGPFAPPPLPAVPQVGYAYPPVQPAYLRPAYPPPHAPPTYYQVPHADHHDTQLVRALPLEAEPSLASEVLATMARFWLPFAALGAIAVALAGYRLLKDDDKVAAVEPAAPIVMAAVPAEPEPAPVRSPLAAAMVGERLAPQVVVEPIVEPIVEPAVAAVAAEPDAVPADSPWQPTKPQPTIAPAAESVAAVEAAPAVEVAAPAVVDPAPVARSNSKSKKKASKDRSQSRRAKRAAAKRAKQIAMAEPAPARTIAPKETKVVAIAATKPMKIGATTAESKGSGAGKLTVSSTPSTLIYVDGRNTGMMTPKTLSLPEGSHKITLLSPKDRIAKTISVDIESGKSAKVSKDFTN